MPAATGAVATILALLLLPLGISPLRRAILSRPLLERVRRLLPPMSQTERTAIEAGTVWWEAELFRGEPDWHKLLEIPKPRLQAEERAFLEGPVEELCAMLDDWHINEERNDLPPEVWAFLRKHRFFGLIIPKEYGGHGFSALAHSSVVMKVSSRSGTAGVSVMVPNSLGPGELLLHFGTEVQKHYYLPRLARGEEIPCFALTGPTAGSDAGSIPDVGIVCQGHFEGQEVLGMRVSWEKRYITLGPVATVLGLAFKVFDPDHLLGENEDLGITCALIPTDTAGVEIGSRHHPGAAFQNGPNRGVDVFVPMEWVIGGPQRVGDGWRMLMESLATGRGISLPALGAGAGKLAARTSGAYARIRKQFRLPIGYFEGVEEVLARIGGWSYRMDAARTLTTSALDQGERPSVVSAMVKYHLTEGYRQTINDAMDIHGGKGICMGPSNYLAIPYRSIPVSITVEGANILTRSMIVFGQGAMRCHPYLVDEVNAAADETDGLRAFDRALYGHLGYTLRNGARSLVFGLSAGRLADSPVDGPSANYFRRLAALSAGFAFLADLGLLVLGGDLKRREALSGRYADALGQMYLCSATLKRFEDDGRPEADVPLMHWAARDSLARAEDALHGILRNFPSAVLGRLLRWVVLPRGRNLREPDDRLGHKVARLLLSPSETRDRLTAGIYCNENPDDPIGVLEWALPKVISAEPVERKLREARIERPLVMDFEDWLALLVNRDVLSSQEAELLREAETATAKVIRVDDFPAKARSAAADQAA
ncbi:MAG: acyl-CoA dehydrogenase [Chromatiales bacterium]|nr:acyl-CoA dehydrogenase [Chromatiales bacterium]